ncbi:MAG: cytidine deaminase [Candidatus Micrarchaeota archaeon]|nr:cytidine deaminase [Candidatus Micrarchaeota archaeon]
MQMKFAKKLKWDDKLLLDAAELAMRQAYNPYSKFSVGAAVLAKDGTIFTGANVENASYGNTICAERSAILNANAAGHRDIVALAVIAGGEKPNKGAPSFSCGACRQAEFEASQVSELDIRIITSNTDRSKISVMKISELLPFGFGPKDLKVDLSRFTRSK